MGGEYLPTSFNFKIFSLGDLSPLVSHAFLLWRGGLSFERQTHFIKVKHTVRLSFFVYMISNM